MACEEKETMELTRLGVFWEANGSAEFGGGKERAVVEGGDEDGGQRRGRRKERKESGERSSGCA